MKLLKIFSLAITISFLSVLVLTNVQAQETDSAELANVLVEFETDKIDASSFNIEEPTALPGEFKYNWQIFKENAGLFFTFDKKKKLEKLEDISNRRLLEAKQLAELGANNAANRVEEALRRYETVREKINTRLEANPELKEKLLEKFDANEIKHQQILSTVTERLRNKVPEDQINRLENLKKEDALRWYNANRDNIQSRLEKAIDNNNIGSKFKQLKNIATLEELSDILPEEAKGKIEAAKARAEERLSKKLENANSQDKEKLEKYINNIKIPELTKQRFISNLKDNEKLPPAIREKAKNIFNNYSNILRSRFQNLDDKDKRKFLNKFEDKLQSHPANIQFLKSLDDPENKDRIKNLLETQSERIKERIKTTTDPAKLRILKKNLQDSPVLRRQIQQRQIEIKNDPSPRPALIP